MTDNLVQRLRKHIACMQEQKDRSIKMQKLAMLAKTEPEKARKELQKLDRQPRVNDAGNYFEDIKQAVDRIESLESINRM